jgi:hypothetical protein
MNHGLNSLSAVIYSMASGTLHTWFASTMSTLPSSYPITSRAIPSLFLSCARSPPTFSLKCRYPFASVSCSSPFILSSPYPNQPALVVYAGTASLLSASCRRSSLPSCARVSSSSASSGVSASVM